MPIAECVKWAWAPGRLARLTQATRHRPGRPSTTGTRLMSTLPGCLRYRQECLFQTVPCISRLRNSCSRRRCKAKGKDMPLVQILLTLVFYIWLFLVLWLLWISSQRLLKLLQTLTDIALKTAEAAHKTAETVYHVHEEDPKK